MLNTDCFDQDLHATKPLPALRVPAFRDFAVKMINEMDSSPESLWNCCSTLSSLALSRAALEYIEAELLTSLQVPSYSLQLKLFECDRFTLFLKYLPSKPNRATTLRSSIENRLITLVGGLARVVRYEQPHPEPFNVFDSSRSLTCLGEVSLSAGEVIKCRAGVECHDVVVDSHSVFFELRSKPIHKLEWLYDASTLNPRRLIFVDALDMKINMYLLLAHHFRSPKSIPLIRPYLQHPNHFIRLSAAKALLQIEPENAATLLEELGKDSHPQLRAAAQRTIGVSSIDV